MDETPAPTLSVFERLYAARDRSLADGRLPHLNNIFKSQSPEAKVAKHVIGELATRFPLCFSREQHRPLKIGIHVDLTDRCPDIGIWSLHLALVRYISTTAYQRCLKAGAPRFDLDGNEIGIVTENGEKHAAAKIIDIEKRMSPPSEWSPKGLVK